MTDLHTGQSAAPRNVSSLLNSLGEQKRNCTVLVAGSPGGAIHLRDGLVVAVETPGAPTVEGLLLRSGRVTEEAWAAVCAADPHHERTAAELAGRGLVGAGEFEVVCTAAVFDGAFALSLTTPGSWEVAEATPVVRSGRTVRPERLIRESSNRLAVLSDARGSAGERARSRVRRTSAAEHGTEGTVVPRRLPARVRAVLDAADGRRTSRDIAFALGRGLYPVLLDLRRLEDDGLVEREIRVPVPRRPSTAPRSLPARTPFPETPATGALPRRVPGGNSLQPSSEPPSAAH
ncbi:MULTISPECIES: hypothetical protein [unclassified Streptomyces]|uniref:hypothetical protein n=1 Tax=unclassified Streptomyces TaxID=2593676 RepID=UPI0011CE8400|nr:MULTISPECIES: hypothetical protein [unclassified Streptomyces]TXS60767.1 hypothetical protein EAO69_41255 [Streptomyces sp. me109]